MKSVTANSVIAPITDQTNIISPDSMTILQFETGLILTIRAKFTLIHVNGPHDHAQ